MKKSLLLAAALVALSGCVSHDFSAGRRENYRCDAGKEFSLREVAGTVEVFASGQTTRLAPSGNGYSDGVVTLTRDGGRATLAGVYGGPFENCRRRGARFW